MVSARAAVRDMASVPTSMVQEGLHTAAYNGGLGNPYLYFNGPLSTGMLEHFQKTNFTGDRVVVSAAGVDHAAFVGVRECPPSARLLHSTPLCSAPRPVAPLALCLWMIAAFAATTQVLRVFTHSLARQQRRQKHAQPQNAARPLWTADWTLRGS